MANRKAMGHEDGNELPRGTLRDKLTDPAVTLFADIGAARIIVGMSTKGGGLFAVYGQSEYLSEGGPQSLPDGPLGKIREGISDKNRFLPPGTCLVGIDPDSDDLDALLLVVKLFRGKLDVTDPASN